MTVPRREVSANYGAHAQSRDRSGRWRRGGLDPSVVYVDTPGEPEASGVRKRGTGGRSNTDDGSADSHDSGTTAPAPQSLPTATGAIIRHSGEDFEDGGRPADEVAGVVTAVGAQGHDSTFVVVETSADGRDVASLVLHAVEARGAWHDDMENGLDVSLLRIDSNEFTAEFKIRYVVYSDGFVDVYINYTRRVLQCLAPATLSRSSTRVSWSTALPITTSR